jgi:hypothetical protein
MHHTDAAAGPPVTGERAGGEAIQENTTTIQVTIGRIEVRATPPPAAPARKRTRPAGKSLDDYLEQRALGGNQ